MSLASLINAMPSSMKKPTVQPPTESPILHAAITPALVSKSAFAEDTDPVPTMQDIAAALDAKRSEQRAKLKRLAEITTEFAKLHQEQADILNSFDA